jgi:hypothetical protein
MVMDPCGHPMPGGHECRLPSGHKSPHLRTLTRDENATLTRLLVERAGDIVQDWDRISAHSRWLEHVDAAHAAEFYSVRLWRLPGKSHDQRLDIYRRTTE